MGGGEGLGGGNHRGADAGVAEDLSLCCSPLSSLLAAPGPQAHPTCCKAGMCGEAVCAGNTR